MSALYDQPYRCLWIGHVLEAEFCESSECYHWGQLSVHRVDVLGNVINFELREQRVEIQVDDGTGVLSCSYFRPTNADEQLDRLSSVPGLSRDAQPLLLSHLPAGTLVHVRGRLVRRHHLPHVFVDTLRLPEDPGEEWSRAVRLRYLYKQVYRKSSVPSTEEAAEKKKKVSPV